MMLENALLSLFSAECVASLPRCARASPEQRRRRGLLRSACFLFGQEALPLRLRHLQELTRRCHPRAPTFKAWPEVEPVW
jgi:hypothetical protein